MAPKRCVRPAPRNVTSLGVKLGGGNQVKGLEMSSSRAGVGPKPNVRGSQWEEKGRGRLRLRSSRLQWEADAGGAPGTPAEAGTGPPLGAWRLPASEAGNTLCGLRGPRGACSSPRVPGPSQDVPLRQEWGPCSHRGSHDHTRPNGHTREHPRKARPVTSPQDGLRGLAPHGVGPGAVCCYWVCSHWALQKIL